MRADRRLAARALRAMTCSARRRLRAQSAAGRIDKRQHSGRQKNPRRKSTRSKGSVGDGKPACASFCQAQQRTHAALCKNSGSERVCNARAAAARPMCTRQRVVPVRAASLCACPLSALHHANNAAREKRDPRRKDNKQRQIVLHRPRAGCCEPGNAPCCSRAVFSAQQSAPGDLLHRRQHQKGRLAARTSCAAAARNLHDQRRKALLHPHSPGILAHQKAPTPARPRCHPLSERKDLRSGGAKQRRPGSTRRRGARRCGARSVRSGEKMRACSERRRRLGCSVEPGERARAGRAAIPRAVLSAGVAEQEKRGARAAMPPERERRERRAWPEKRQLWRWRRGSKARAGRDAEDCSVEAERGKA
ncbi:hypothetical protein FA09DRAFT_194698 [Tilletiopsis washingtonensis]|jgi:hypothetical protein|uniref:Uncharacterized protein n=1 Tax=Tilletiopsis washingtonensis TaxID=58919 RepID=A0A316YZ01_9BASI|nr:hypothetical protein FA09DRAFT_194698 [Tilletiopsis washingtonensis]PWN94489.1 hypothetical protein FA09DRAFT_194698 [Tilletiopsis washingtonensis]